ncbi:MAG: 16S rRNA (cytosine(1402)-N(4))-methyltransferase RsmH, partial [Minisyncoccales bacterium]
RETIEGLNLSEGKNFIDCTFGLGGHSREILKRIGKKGRVLAFEYDNQLYPIIKKIYQSEKRLIIVNENFKDLARVVKEKNFFPVSGILVDLGVCSWQIEKKKGFSFWRNEELDMRYNSSKQKERAQDILNKKREKELVKIFKKYGQIKSARELARRILRERPLKTTFQLKKILESFQKKERKIVRKVFLALRLATNRELENLKEMLEQAIFVLEKKGRLAIISYHSLEERLIKHFFRMKKKFLKVISPKPILPSPKEIKENRRSRSAKLFLAEKK